MAFPSSPANGQRASVNNIIYEYNDTKGAWLRVSAQGFTSANLTVGGIITDNYYRADGTSLLGVNKSVYNGTALVTTSATLVDSIPTAGNTSVTWSLTSKDTDNSTYKNSVVSSLNDGTNVYYSEYGIILSNASVSVSTFTSNIVAGNLRLYAVGDSANVSITFQRTLLGSSTDVGYITAGASGAQGPEGNIGNVNSTANVVTSGYFIGNGSQLTGIVTGSSYGNTEVATYLTTYTGNIGNLKTTSNVITTGYFIGNGSQLTGLPVSYGNTEVATYLTTYTGNIGNLKTTSNVITTGYFIGNGSQLTGLPISYGNTEVATYLTTYTGNLSASTTTIDGNLTVSGNLIVNGNVTYINANNFNINDSLIYLADDNPADTLDIGFVSAFTDATRYQHTGLVRDATDGVWKLFANVVAEPTSTIDFTNANYSNLQIGNLIANNIGGTLTTAGQTNITSVGNLVNLSTSGNISTTGYFLGNAALLTGLPSSYGNTQVASYLPTYTGAFGNLSSGITASGPIRTTGIIFANASIASTSTTTGALVVTGGVGISGNLFVGGALTESSSATLKENITPIDGALDLILQLTGVIYDRQDGSRKNEAGLIAEEVNKVLPNLITLDDQGTPMGVQYTKLTAYLIEAVKSLKAEIDQLKKRD